jgi:deoxyribose-phosphate aldolase
MTQSSTFQALNSLSPEERKNLVTKVAGILRQQMHREMVPPADECRGTWENTGDLRTWSNQVDRLGTDGTIPSSGSQMAKYIDHTLLKPTATRKDIIKLCGEAREYGFASVCVNSSWIKIAAEDLAGCPTMAIAVVGFPLGAMATHSKAEETRQAIRDGAEEIDMVINIGALKGGDFDLVYDDICAVVKAAGGWPVKVILETTMLTRDEKITGCTISKAAKAHFVKTSTGFGGGGATIEDVLLMRSIVGEEMGVKASGGVRNAVDLQNMVKAGANRIGASAGIAIVSGKTSKSGY